MLCRTAAAQALMPPPTWDLDGKAFMLAVASDDRDLLGRVDSSLLHRTAGGPHRTARDILRWLCVMRC